MVPSTCGICAPVEVQSTKLGCCLTQSLTKEECEIVPHTDQHTFYYGLSNGREKGLDS